MEPSVDDAVDRDFMALAIDVARKCQSKPDDPLVGAIAVAKGQILGKAHRGEVEAGEHAEYTLLERHLKDIPLAGATVYTTLEPCTERNPPKIGCVDRLIHRKVARVVIGMLDPNPLVSGFGYRKLRRANIAADLFPPDLMAQLEELNRDFARAIETNAVHRATQEIAALATRSGTVRQRLAVGEAIQNCLDSLRRVNEGQISISGREAGYFARLWEVLDGNQERLKGYIRLTAFEPDKLPRGSWFENAYMKFDEAVSAGRLTVEYIFFLRKPPTETVKNYLARFQRFAHRINLVYENDPRLAPDTLRPSVVLLQNQQIAFTHDRGEDAALTEAFEWIRPEDYERLRRQYDRIEILSTPYFTRSAST
jgi:pyrimidine deaminase RibD-like protein